MHLMPPPACRCCSRARSWRAAASRAGTCSPSPAARCAWCGWRPTVGAKVAGFALPGDFVGLSGASTYPHDIEALGETELCRFGLDAMQRLGERFPHLQGKLLERACVELDSAHERMMSLARMNPTERMADFLLTLAQRQARGGDPGQSLLLPMPRADIADHLGLTVETVSRCLTSLRTRGLIALPATYRIDILDRDGLETLKAAA